MTVLGTLGSLFDPLDCVFDYLQGFCAALGIFWAVLGAFGPFGVLLGRLLGRVGPLQRRSNRFLRRFRRLLEADGPRPPRSSGRVMMGPLKTDLEGGGQGVWNSMLASLAASNQIS